MSWQSDLIVYICLYYKSNLLIMIPLFVHEQDEVFSCVKVENNKKAVMWFYLRSPRRAFFCFFVTLLCPFVTVAHDNRDKSVDWMVK